MKSSGANRWAGLRRAMSRRGMVLRTINTRGMVPHAVDQMQTALGATAPDLRALRAAGTRVAPGLPLRQAVPPEASVSRDVASK